MDQENKSIRRMPWHQEPKKDATGCEKPRRGAYILRSVGVRMGKPVWQKARHHMMRPVYRSSHAEGTRGTETS